MLAPLLIALHLLISLALIGLILLHSSKGGGLGDAFGGGIGPAGGMGGSTLAEKNLSRLTVIVAFMFAATTFALAWVLD